MSDVERLIERLRVAAEESGYGTICTEAAAMLRSQADALASSQAEVRRFRGALFHAGVMEEPPCFFCGYNGEGYYQPDKHPCAAEHHAALQETTP